MLKDLSILYIEPDFFVISMSDPSEAILFSIVPTQKLPKKSAAPSLHLLNGFSGSKSNIFEKDLSSVLKLFMP